MNLIDGKKIAAELRNELKLEVDVIKKKFNKVPGLTVILIGDLAPSQIYVRNKEKSAKEIGLKSEIIKYPKDIKEISVLNKIDELNNDETVSGILVQLPLPDHIDKQKIIERINPDKDADGFHPYNVGNLSSPLAACLRSNPASAECVNVISLSAPNFITALSDNINKSSPMTASFATDRPPSVCSEPSVVDVASVVSSVITLPDTQLVNQQNSKTFFQLQPHSHQF